MRVTRVLILAGLAMTATLVLLASSAAAETVLCANGTPEEAVCGEGAGKTRYEGPVATTSSSWVLNSSITTVTCHSQLTLDPASSSGEATIAAEITALSFSGCKTTGGTECTNTAVNLPYSATLEPGESENLLRVADPVGVGFTAKCGALINCTFSTKETIWKDTGGPPVSFAGSKVALSRTGGLCPATAEWNFAYEAVEPVGFAIGPSSAAETVLCANGTPEEAVCGEGAGKTRYEGPVATTSSSWS